MTAKQEQGMAATVGIMGGRELQPPPCHCSEMGLRRRTGSCSSGVIEEKAAVKALISDTHFNLPSFVHNPGFCFLQVCIPLFLNHQVTMSY